ncbi:MAG: hypothetical protein HRT54_13025 [Colwellia sp.]|nr:hypothetical protein [Colwellia sp.]
MPLPTIFWSPKNDPEISPDNTGRDPLGIQPIWSGAGRMIVPHFASGISRYEGLLAVLLGYEVASHLSLSLKDTRKFFYTWEALVETQWHSNSEPERYVLFGKRFLANGLDSESLLPKNHKNVLTYRKGLWNFYRGTLRRAGLLTQTLELGNNNRIQWPEGELRELVSFFEKYYKNRETILLKEAADKLGSALEICWQHEDGLQCLKGNLYQGETNKLCNEWTLACKKMEGLEGEFSWNKVIKYLPNDTDNEVNTTLSRRLTLLSKVDPWLAVLDAISHWLDGQDQSSTTELFSQLESYSSQNIVEIAAKNFPGISDIEDEIRTEKVGDISSTMHKRWLVFSELAKYFLAQQWPEFINKIVHYHHSITIPEKRRWRLDSSLLLCYQAKQNAPLNMEVKQSSLKYQTYYLHTARNIHNQLSGALV